PAAISTAASATNAERSRADQTRIWRLDQRSMKTPANGPTSEYGRYRTVNAAAPAAGLGNDDALKNTYVPTPAVMIPSPACETSRVESRRRKFFSARTARRSPSNDDLRGRPATSSVCPGPWLTHSAYPGALSRTGL